MLTYFIRQTKAMLMPGLPWRRRVLLMPVLGALVGWLVSILKISSVRQQMEAEIARLHHAQSVARESILAARASIAEVDGRLAAQLEQLIVATRQLHAPTRLNHLEEVARAQTLANVERDRQIGRLVRALAEMLNSVLASNAQVRDTTDRDAPFGDAQPASDNSGAKPRLGSAALDSFYFDFEEKFRGTSSEITQRLAVYLPYVMPLEQADIGADAPVVDIGCGRGEWLSMLRQRGIPAIGIDLNQEMVNRCRSAGLDAQCADALHYLRGLPAGSVAAVTGFHIIEHLPLTELLGLFDAALRALRPGGVVIFETPNPENLLVGSLNFYMDPTHRNPIVPMVAEFMATQRGFARAEIVRLNPYPSDHYVNEDSAAAALINRKLFGPQDYALVAWKSGAD